MITKFFVARNTEWDSNVTLPLIGPGNGPLSGGGEGRKANIESSFKQYIILGVNEKRQNVLTSLSGSFES